MAKPDGVRDRYEAPALQVIGTLADITRQNFTNSNVDFNFAGVELTGTTS
jgi:hypothetical protein